MRVTKPSTSLVKQNADQFVREHMTGDVGVLATYKETQSIPAFLIPPLALSLSIGIPCGLVIGSLTAGLGIVSAGFAYFGFLGMFEICNRVVVTRDQLLVQHGTRVQRFDLSAIEASEVATLRPMDLARIRGGFFRASNLLRGRQGVRFRFRKPSGDGIDCFLGVSDPQAVVDSIDGARVESANVPSGRCL